MSFKFVKTRFAWFICNKCYVFYIVDQDPVSNPVILLMMDVYRQALQVAGLYLIMHLYNNIEYILRFLIVLHTEIYILELSMRIFQHCIYMVRYFLLNFNFHLLY